VPKTIYSIHKKYPNHTKIIQYNQSWNTIQKAENKKARIDQPYNNELHIIRNTIRAKTTISDIVACNQFQYFVTLTIDPKTNIDRYSYSDTTQNVSKWLKHHLKHYLLVPEKHKDGAYHFHLLANIDKNQLTKFTNNKTKYTKYYNINSYKLGFSSAIKIKPNSQDKLSSYIKKYITKDLISSVPKNRHRYWCSKNLLRPTVSYNEIMPKNALPTFQHEYYTIYTSQHTDIN